MSLQISSKFPATRARPLGYPRWRRPWRSAQCWSSWCCWGWRSARRRRGCRRSKGGTLGRPQGFGRYQPSRSMSKSNGLRKNPESKIRSLHIRNQRSQGRIYHCPKNTVLQVNAETSVYMPQLLRYMWNPMKSWASNCAGFEGGLAGGGVAGVGTAGVAGVAVAARVALVQEDKWQVKSSVNHSPAIGNHVAEPGL